MFVDVSEDLICACNTAENAFGCTHQDQMQSRDSGDAPDIHDKVQCACAAAA